MSCVHEGSVDFLVAMPLFGLGIRANVSLINTVGSDFSLYILEYFV